MIQFLLQNLTPKSPPPGPCLGPKYSCSECDAFKVEYEYMAALNRTNTSSKGGGCQSVRLRLGRQDPATDTASRSITFTDWVSGRHWHGPTFVDTFHQSCPLSKIVAVVSPPTSSLLLLTPLKSSTSSSLVVKVYSWTFFRSWSCCDPRSFDVLRAAAATAARKERRLKILGNGESRWWSK